MKLLLLGSLIVFLLVTVVALELQRKPYVLPKIVWTHWDSPNPPDHVQQVVNRMREVLPDWSIRLLTTNDFLQSVSPREIPANFDTLGVAHQADWIRLKLLQKYGGCWIDSGVILNQSINPLYRECVTKKADVVVFKILGMQTNPKYPVGENWFIMAPQNSPFISLWLEEYEYAIDIGFHAYKKDIKAQGVDLQNLMKSSTDVYLTQHGCFQKVLQKRMPSSSTIIFPVAEDTMFRIQAKDCNWESKCIELKLKDKAYCQTIPYIKLRGADRKLVKTLPL